MIPMLRHADKPTRSNLLSFLYKTESNNGLKVKEVNIGSQRFPNEAFWVAFHMPKTEKNVRHSSLKKVAIINSKRKPLSISFS